MSPERFSIAALLLSSSIHLGNFLVEALAEEICTTEQGCDAAIDVEVQGQQVGLLQKNLPHKGLSRVSREDDNEAKVSDTENIEGVLELDATSDTRAQEKKESLVEKANASIALSELSKFCTDTPNWGNNYNCRSQGKGWRDGCASNGWTCDGYRGQGWCANEGPAPGMEFAFAGWANNPGANCCGCGKGKNACAFYGCVGFTHHHTCQCNSDCAKYNSCCPDYQDFCVTGKATHRTMKGYHQTSKEVCKLIMAGNFKPGHGGWCGGAVYFAMSPEATVTKAIADSSHDGCMIEATVDVGKQKRAGKTCDGLTASRCKDRGFDSVIFNPGDGDELVIYDPSKIQSKRILPYKESWRVPSLRRRRRGN